MLYEFMQHNEIVRYSWLVAALLGNQTEFMMSILEKQGV